MYRYFNILTINTKFQHEKKPILGEVSEISSRQIDSESDLKMAADWITDWITQKKPKSLLDSGICNR